MLDLVILVLTVFLTTLYLVERWRDPTKHLNLPPGPWGLPVLGALPYLGRSPHITITSWVKKYGDIIYCRMGKIPVLILGSAEAVKEGLVGQGKTFSGRPDFQELVKHLLDPEDRKQGGVVMSEGLTWLHQRRFTLSSLRDFGVGRSSLEGKIKAEIDAVIEEIIDRSEEGRRPIDISSILEISVANVICSIVFGERYEYQDTEFVNLLHDMQRAIRLFGKNAPLNFLPHWLTKLPPFSWNVTEALALRTQMFATFKRLIEEHKQGSEELHEPRDFIDAYLMEIRKQSDGKEDIMNEKQLVSVIGDLFGAGSDTTNTTLKWGFLYMGRWPEIQEKVQAEVDAVVGRSRLPTLQDRPRLCYTEACICEMQRMANIIPFGLMHRVTESCKLRGYDIPEDTVVIPNLWSVHNDEKAFPNPFQFDPNRFLDDKGRLVKPDAFMPFSVGKRACLGESLAKMELFLFFACLIHRFTFSLPEGEGMREGELGIVLSPAPYTIYAKVRD